MICIYIYILFTTYNNIYIYNYIYIEQLYIGKTGTLGSLKFLGAVSPYPHMLQTQPHVSFGARWWTNTEILERTEHPTNSCNMLQISAYVKKKL